MNPDTQWVLPDNLDWLAFTAKKTAAATKPILVALLVPEATNVVAAVEDNTTTTKMTVSPTEEDDDKDSTPLAHNNLYMSLPVEEPTRVRHLRRWDPRNIGSWSVLWILEWESCQSIYHDGSLKIRLDH